MPIREIMATQALHRSQSFFYHCTVLTRFTLPLYVNTKHFPSSPISGLQQGLAGHLECSSLYPCLYLCHHLPGLSCCFPLFGNVPDLPVVLSPGCSYVLFTCAKSVIDIKALCVFVSFVSTALPPCVSQSVIT